MAKTPKLTPEQRQAQGGLVVWKVDALTDGSGQIHHVSASLVVVDAAQAAYLASRFPRFVRVKAGTISGAPEGTGFLSFQVSFSPDQANKGKNETGFKRLRAFLAITRWEFHRGALNSATREVFDAFVK